MPNKTAEKPRVFIDKVHLKGFKSIEDITVNLNKGLNILIGKNGSGKSNFLELMNQAFQDNIDARPKILFEYAKLDFLGYDGYSFAIEIEKYLRIGDFKSEESAGKIGVSEKLFIENILEFDSSDDTSTTKRIRFKDVIIKYSSYRSYLFRQMGYGPLYPFFIRFNLPQELNFIDRSESIKINPEDLFEYAYYPDTLVFLNDVFDELGRQIGTDGSKLQTVTVAQINKSLILEKSILENIKKFTPIEDIKFNRNINLYHIDEELIIDNVKLEFKINGNWMPWSQLSDGTKRLFYIVAEVTHAEGLILIEEPELGIHPHQFNLLMDFLKEQSEHKQILISTHSPKALDHLSPEELDSILIASYDLKKGTQIRHLTNKETNKAKKYMKEVGFFSDYWMLSDLEE